MSHTPEWYEDQIDELKAELSQVRASLQHVVSDMTRVQASAKFTQDQRLAIIELCHELTNRRMMNEQYLRDNDLPSYTTSHAAQEAALRTLLDERDRLADRVWQLEKALQLVNGERTKK
jgi:hypothetical protein